MEQYNELKDLVLSIEADVEKFFNKGNKSAGVRVRKVLQDIKAHAQLVRVKISEENSK